MNIPDRLNTLVKIVKSGTKTAGDIGRWYYIAVVYPQTSTTVVQLGVEEKKVFFGKAEFILDGATLISPLNLIPVTTIFVRSSHRICGNGPSRYINKRNIRLKLER